MGAGPPLEFWFEFASTYSYPAAERIGAAAREAGVEVVWRPFLLGPVLKQQGWDDSPFNLYPLKGRYMWRDVERLCVAGQLPFRRPSAFPRNSLLAARIATLGCPEPWGPDFVRAVYRANFGEDRDIAEPAVLSDVLRRVGVASPERMLTLAAATETKERLRRSTEEAMRRGIFGAPSFLVGDELFWGGDRLDQALDHAAAIARAAG
jgi:2-hydroxychromene-2-carboxylate isomerase